MSFDALEGMPAIAPLEFFSLEGELPFVKAPPTLRHMRKHCLLPSSSEMLGEESFAEVAIAWSEEGVYTAVFVDKPFEEARYPRFAEGDAFELFLDTRDLKNAGFSTRFCHQFLFLPQAVQGISCQELTHFRTEETHVLCDPADLQLSTTFEKKGYQMEIFIPRHVLHGYDPATFDRLGINYRIHRMSGQPQHFALSSQHFNVEQHPRLWASYKLRRSV